MSETEPKRRQRVSESLVEHLKSQVDESEDRDFTNAAVVHAEIVDIMVATYIQAQECECPAHQAAVKLLILSSVMDSSSAQVTVQMLLTCLAKVEVNLNKAQAKADVMDPTIRAQVRDAMAGLDFQ